MKLKFICDIVLRIQDVLVNVPSGKHSVVLWLPPNSKPSIQVTLTNPSPNVLVNGLVELKYVCGKIPFLQTTAEILKTIKNTKTKPKILSYQHMIHL